MSLNLLPSLSRLKNRIEEKAFGVDYWGGISGSDLDTSSSESDSDSNDDSSPGVSRAPSRIDIRKNRLANRLNTPNRIVQTPVAKRARVKSPVPNRTPVKSPVSIRTPVKKSLSPPPPVVKVKTPIVKSPKLKSSKAKSANVKKSPAKLAPQDILSKCLEILNNDMSDSETQPVPDIIPQKSPEISVESPVKKVTVFEPQYSEGLLKIAETTKEAKAMNTTTGGGGKLVETQDVTKLKPLTITVSTAPVKVPTNNNLAPKTLTAGEGGYEGLVTTTINNTFNSMATTLTSNTKSILATTPSASASGSLVTISSVNSSITTPSNIGNNEITNTSSGTEAAGQQNNSQIGQTTISHLGHNSSLLVKQLPQLQSITPQSLTVKPDPLLNTAQPQLVSTIQPKLNGQPTTNPTIQVKPSANLLQANLKVLQPNIQQQSQPQLLLPPPQQPPVTTQQAIIQIIQPPGLPLQFTNGPLPLLNAQGQLMGTINGCNNHSQLLTNLQKFVQMLPVPSLTQPINNLIQPNNNVGLTQPLNNFSLQQPANNLNLVQPANNLNLMQPTNNLNLMQPTNNLNLSQPVTSLNLPQPTTNLNFTQPTTNLNFSQPMSSLNLTNSTSNPIFTQPISNLSLSQPTTNLNLAQPTTNLNFVQPNNIIVQPQSQPVTQNGLSLSQPQIALQQPSVINTSGMSFQQPTLSTINTNCLNLQQPIASTINTNGLGIQPTAVSTSSGLSIQPQTPQQASHQLVQDPTTGLYQVVQNPQPPLIQNNQVLNNFELVNNRPSLSTTPLPTSVLTPQITPKIEPRNCSTPFSIKPSPLKIVKPLLPTMMPGAMETKENKPLIDGPTKFMCGVCNKYFGNTKNLRVHISEIHEGNRGHFPCDVCFKIFPRKRNMERHKNAVHLKQAPKCHLCQKSVVNIEMHIKRFHKESPGEEVNEKISMGFTGVLSSATA